MRQLEEDESGDVTCIVQHSQKATLSFRAKVTEASTDFLDLSQGAKLMVSGIANGTVLCSHASENWALGQAKTTNVTATHYPDMTGGTGDSVEADLDVFTPDQSGLGIVAPGNSIIYGTFGLGHANGIVHSLSIEQQLTITEDDPSPDGKILGATTHGYLRSIQLDLLATGPIPATGSILALTGAPEHAGGYRVESAEVRFASKRGKMYQLTAVWIPTFAE